MKFHNSINLKGKELEKAIAKTKGQSKKIMVFMEANHLKSYTPPEVHEALFDESVPLTSVRRSLTNLTSKGHLRQTDEKREGLYGSENYCWTFRKSL